MKLLGEWKVMKVDELSDEKRDLGRDLALRTLIGVMSECH